VTLPEVLAPLATRPGVAGFLTDFDGTVAPIVDDPARARPRADALGALGRLAGRLSLVAVVSGRPVAFLREHVPLEGVVLVGQYGLERLVDGETVVDERVDAFSESLAAAAAEVERRWPTLYVERKGAAAFGVHWRTRPEAAPPPGALEDLASAHGLSVSASRMAGEVRVPVPVDKGTVVRSLLEDRGLAVCAFAGDDHGDLPAFAALTERARRGDGFVGAKVAVRSPEAPPALLEQADLVVDGPAALAARLEDLVAELRRRA
jgi:trehalose 6-phosphate phosphatase